MQLHSTRSRVDVYNLFDSLPRDTLIPYLLLLFHVRFSDSTCRTEDYRLKENTALDGTRASLCRSGSYVIYLIMETNVELEEEGVCDGSLKFPLSDYIEPSPRFVKCLLTFSAVSHQDSILGREVSREVSRFPRDTFVGIGGSRCAWIAHGRSLSGIQSSNQSRRNCRCVATTSSSMGRVGPDRAGPSQARQAAGLRNATG